MKITLHKYYDYQSIKNTILCNIVPIFKYPNTKESFIIAIKAPSDEEKRYLLTYDSVQALYPTDEEARENFKSITNTYRNWFFLYAKGSNIIDRNTIISLPELISHLQFELIP